jgi:2-polyprenyl-3-methyl-5-hydroxy-6-metoxy-1,4-benzoquinol methylase
MRFEQSFLQFRDYVLGLACRPGVRRICEIGGGANPALPLEFLRQHGLDYTVLDISQEELNKAPEGYTKVQADIASRDFNLTGNYDLVFSKLLAEHVADGEQMHRNIWKILADDGYAFHHFPTLYTVPFLLNRLAPEQWSEQVLLHLAPNRARSSKWAKFPAYYSWCRGPMRRQVQRLESVGYRVEEYVGFFGHDYYAQSKKVRFLDAPQRHLTSFLLKHPVPLFTSYAYLLLQKPSK